MLRVSGIVLLTVVFVLTTQARGAASVADAEGAYRDGQRVLAGNMIREYVRDHPESARIAKVAALLARTAGSPAEALGRWDEVIALEPDGELAAEAHWTKGIHAYSAGLYVSAAQEFWILARAFEDSFDVGRAYLWKGYAELGADLPDEAMESFRQAEGRVRDRFDRRSAMLGRAHASFRLGNVSDALRRYRRFERDYRMDGRVASAARRVVECLRLLGRESEAARAAARIEREYPDSFEATLSRAEIRQSEIRPIAEAAEPKVPTPDEGLKGPFLVQVASMTDVRNAVELRRQIRALGLHDIRVELGEGPAGPVHRVMLGPYETEEQARTVADSVATIGDLNPRVRPMDPTHSRR